MLNNRARKGKPFCVNALLPKYKQPVRTFRSSSSRKTFAWSSGTVRVHKENDSFYSSIPGIGRLFNRNSSTCQKWFWVLVLLVTVSCCLFLIGFRLQHYLHSLPVIRTHQYTPDYIHFPAITICPDVLVKNPILSHLAHHYYPNDRMIRKMANISSIYKLVDVDNITVFSLWDKMDAYILSEPQKFQFVQGHSIANLVATELSVKVENISSPTGTCKTHYIEQSISYKDVNTYFHYRLYHKSRPNYHWLQVYAHPKEDKYRGKYFSTYRCESQLMGDIMIIKYHIHEKAYMNRTEMICDASEVVANCISDCLEKYIYSNSTGQIICRLPFMTYRPDLRPCQTSTEFQRMYETSDSILTSFNKSRCSCPRKCRDITLSIQYLNTMTAMVHNMTSIYIVVADSVTIEEEIWAYSLDAFLSDLGGSLGLFLGVCILSLIELVENVFLHFRKLCKKAGYHSRVFELW